VSQIATSTHTLTFETHRRVLRFEKGEVHTYKRDWMTTMEAVLQPLWWQQWRRLAWRRRPVQRRTGGGETKLLLCGRRNLCDLEQWRSEMEERKMVVAPHEEDKQWHDLF